MKKNKETKERSNKSHFKLIGSCCRAARSLRASALHAF